MTLGVCKRDRIKRRADKAWRSVWHRQMLQPPRSGISIDNQYVVVFGNDVSCVGQSDSKTKPSNDGGSNG